MTVGSTLDAQLAFVNGWIARTDERMEKIEFNVAQTGAYDDEWLHEEMRRMTERLQIPVPELLSRMNDWENRLAKIEQSQTNMLQRIERLEERQRAHEHVNAA